MALLDLELRKAICFLRENQNNFNFASGWAIASKFRENEDKGDGTLVKLLSFTRFLLEPSDAIQVFRGNGKLNSRVFNQMKFRLIKILLIWVHDALFHSLLLSVLPNGARFYERPEWNPLDIGREPLSVWVEESFELHLHEFILYPFAKFGISIELYFL